MTHMRTLSIASLGLLAVAGVLLAQRPAITRTVVTRGDLAADKEAVLAKVEVAPGATMGWHTHPGDEVSYVVDGEAMLMLAGQPPRKLVAGQGFVIPAGTVHNARNEGASALKLTAVYVVRKGAPLIAPAAQP
jgi:quercetin dioxygenase-like cupin family protein